LVLLGLGALIVVLTVVSCFGWLPSLRIVPDNTHFDFTRFRRISFPISALPTFRRCGQSFPASGSAMCNCSSSAAPPRC
jgi:hypothetical protein